MTLAVTWKGSPNYTRGRDGHTPDWTPGDPAAWITLHTMVGYMAGTIAAFARPERQASSTYGVGLDGSIVQFVKESDAPWTNGTMQGVGSNLDSITIECEDAGDYNGPRTPQLYEAAAQLVADIAQRHSIPLVHRGADGGVLGHRECTGAQTACPDALDVDRIIARAREIQASAVGPIPIMAPAVASSAQMLGVLAGHASAYGPATLQGIANAYLSIGAAEGVCGDGAWAQACHETGYFAFGGDVKPAQWNFCGLGATGGGAPGYAFASYPDGVRAHLRHLRAYATTGALPADGADPRGLPASLRGSAPTFHDLGSHWAPSLTYGDAIETLIRTIRQPTFGPVPGQITGGDSLDPANDNDYAAMYRIAVGEGNIKPGDVPARALPYIKDIVPNTVLAAKLDQLLAELVPGADAVGPVESQLQHHFDDVINLLNAQRVTIDHLVVSLPSLLAPLAVKDQIAMLAAMVQAVSDKQGNAPVPGPGVPPVVDLGPLQAAVDAIKAKLDKDLA